MLIAAGTGVVARSGPPTGHSEACAQVLCHRGLQRCTCETEQIAVSSARTCLSVLLVLNSAAELHAELHQAV
jgi:hypothetical protein